jgi:hypothetical protein
MKRLLFFSIPLTIVACSILPIVGGAKQEEAEAGMVDSTKDEMPPLRFPVPTSQQNFAQYEKPRAAKKIAANSILCSSITADSLRAEISAKLDCLVELKQ